MAVVAVLTAASFDPKLYINGDNVSYLEMAGRILDGELWPSSKYPPLFPMLLAPIRALFGTALVPCKILVLLGYLASVALLVPVFRRRLAGPPGAVLFAVALGSVPVVEYAHYVMSEIPFLVCLSGAILLFDRVVADVEDRPAADTGASTGTWALRDPRIWALAACLAAGFYVRTAGAAAGLGLGLALLLRRRHAAAGVLLLGFLLGAAPWIVKTLREPGGNAYFEQLVLVNPYYPEFGRLDLEGLVTRLRFNLTAYFREIVPVTLLNVPYRSTYSSGLAQKTFQPLLLALPLTAIFLAGLARGLIRRDGVAWSVAASLALVLVWPPIWAANRFLVPLVPFLFLVAADGFRAIGGFRPLGDRLRGPVRRAAVVASLGLLVLVGAVSYLRYFRESRTYPPEWAHYFAALEWIGRETPGSFRVADRKPGFVEWVSQREAIPFPREAEPEAMRAFLARERIDLVVFPSLPYDDIRRYLEPAVAGLEDYLSIAYVAGDDRDPAAPVTYVFRFHPEGGRTRPGPGS